MKKTALVLIILISMSLLMNACKPGVDSFASKHADQSMPWRLQK